MRLATALSVERRWAVSGSESLSSYALMVLWLILAPAVHMQQGGESEIASLSTYERKPTQSLWDAEQATSTAWGRASLDDVGKIGVMLGGFLAAEPFKSDDGFQMCVTARLRRKDGPSFGAVKRLKSLMDAVMVKHQWVHVCCCTEY